MSNDQHDKEEDEEIILASKSQLKRESHALQTLGEELVELPAAKLAKIPMPEELADAVALARKIKARGGRKRQLQYIGKVMRKIDPAPVQQALEGLKVNSARETARLHKLEQWRDRLVSEGDEALAELLQAFPGADRQHLRQLMRNAQREAKQSKPPKSARELFRYLRELE
ncbi:MAG: ribosome-associated protein [Gammaproteobacteria bacterium]|nr:ribosome-associated protein [Gammaproteobacteria bacterium]